MGSWRMDLISLVGRTYVNDISHFVHILCPYHMLTSYIYFSSHSPVLEHLVPLLQELVDGGKRLMHSHDCLSNDNFATRRVRVRGL